MNLKEFELSARIAKIENTLALKEETASIAHVAIPTTADITEKYIIVIDRNTAEIKVYDRQTNAITAEYQELKVYKNFYVTVTYDKGTEEYTIRNKDLDSIIQYKRIKSRNIWR